MFTFQKLYTTINFLNCLITLLTKDSTFFLQIAECKLKSKKCTIQSQRLYCNYQDKIVKIIMLKKKIFYRQKFVFVQFGKKQRRIVKRIVICERKKTRLYNLWNFG